MACVPKADTERIGILLKLKTMKTQNLARRKDTVGLNQNSKNQLYQGISHAIKQIR